MGYAHGSVSSSPCGFYGGEDLCGAAGSPVVGLFVCVRRLALATCSHLPGNGGPEMLGLGMECGGQHLYEWAACCGGRPRKALTDPRVHEVMSAFMCSVCSERNI